LVGAALQVTDPPGQNGLGVAVMVTPAGSPVLTIIVMELDVAGLPEVHGKDEFMMQLTTSPPAGVYVYVELLGPTFIPLTFH
jgi:hypothetical protein